MNINPEKIKELVLLFAELDEEYQKELMAKAYTLSLMQSQKNQMQQEKSIYKTDKEREDEIKRRSNQRAKEAMEIVENIEKMNDTDKAAMFMLLNRLAGKGNMVQKPDISITINQRDISMEEYLKNYLLNADYDKAKDKVQDFEAPKVIKESEINESYCLSGCFQWNAF